MRALVLVGLGLLAFAWLVSHAPKAHAQVLDPTDTFVDASGGDGGSARGGDGGRGGEGVLGSCSSNVNDADELGILDCASGGQGGAGGDAGESVGGNGGVAFAIGQPPQPSPPTGAADLAVAKTAPATVINCGLACTVTEVVTVRNIGSQTANAVTLVDSSTFTAPSGFVVSAAATPSQGTCGTTHVPGTTTCSLGDLAPGAAATVTINVVLHVDITPGVLQNTATASTPSPEVTTANNSASTTTTNP
jgi:hypothetical protein